MHLPLFAPTPGKDNSTHGSTALQCQHGGVILEFSIVIPVLVLFFTMIVQGGLYVSQSSRVGETAYHATMVGGRTSQSDRSGAMSQRADEVKTILVRKIDLHEMTPSEDTANRTVSMHMTGNLQTVLPGFSLPIDFTFTGPVLLSDADPSDSIENFGNSACSYDLSYARTCPLGTPVTPTATVIYSPPPPTRLTAQAALTDEDAAESYTLAVTAIQSTALASLSAIYKNLPASEFAALRAELSAIVDQIVEEVGPTNFESMLTTDPLVESIAQQAMDRLAVQITNNQLGSGTQLSQIKFGTETYLKMLELLKYSVSAATYNSNINSPSWVDSSIAAITAALAPYQSGAALKNMSTDGNLRTANIELAANAALTVYQTNQVAQTTGLPASD